MTKENKFTLLLWLFSVAYTIPAYDKYWAPFDEGIIAVAAQRLLAGELPYKDFFIAMYPPGQIYALAAIFKLFSSSLIAGRIYAVFVSVSISMLTFFMAHDLTKDIKLSFFSWLISLGSLGPRLGTIPAPIWPGMALSLFSIYLFSRYYRDSKPRLIFFAGLTAGASITFRHDIGLFASLAIFISLVIQSYLYRSRFKSIIYFVSAILLVTLPWVIYFVMLSASHDIFNSLLVFPFIHSRTARIPFPTPCLDLKMIFHGSLHFININQFYIPIIIYTYTIFLLLAKIVRRSLHDERENLSLLSLLLFGVFAFNQVVIRPDPAHLLTVAPPAMVLCAFILHDAFSNRSNLKTERVLKFIASALILFLFALLLIKNVDKYIKNTYTKVYKKDIIKVELDRGAIYIPKEELEEVTKTLGFIKENTSPEERIYIGNTAHWKDNFGGSTIIYFLANRLPCTKFYELLPGLVTEKDVQEEIMDSLNKNNVKLIVLQDVDSDKTRRTLASKDRFLLDNFIKRKFSPVAKFGKYNIYRRSSR